MAITLDDISKQLAEGQKSEEKQEEHLKVISKFFVDWSRGALGRAEAASERKPAQQQTMFQKGQQAGQDFDLLKMFGLGALALNLQTLAASLGAVTAALAGLRGWETQLLADMKNWRAALTAAFTPITKITSRIATAVDDITRGVLTKFGIDPDTGVMARDAKGRFTGKVPKTTLQMMDDAAGGLVSKVTAGFDKVMSPIRAVGTAFDTYIVGPGAKLFGFIDGVLGLTKGAAALGGFASFMGKLLWPFGIFMSALDGIEAYKKTEGTEWDKFSAGISAFVGDFIGAPLDLIKNGLAWVLDKFGFDETSAAIKDFNIEEKITNAVAGVLAFGTKAFKWIGTLFTDPTEALKQLWSGIAGEGGVVEVVGGWLRDFWNWFTGILPDIGAIADNLKQAIWDKLPAWVRDNVNISYVSTNNDRTRMMENEDKVMSQQVTGGEQRTYTTRADIQKALSFDWDAYRSMNEGGDPYARQLQPIIVQDNSTTNNSSSAVNQVDARIPSENFEWYQRRAAMGLGF